MSEKTIQEGIQATIQALAAFDNADVVINDWDVLDQSTAQAPYVIIQNTDDPIITMQTLSGNMAWSIPVTLIERFTDWKETLNNFRTRRQAIFDTYNAAGTARSAGGIEAVDIHTIRTDGPIENLYDPDMPDDLLDPSSPIFITQRFIFEVDEGWG